MQKEIMLKEGAISSVEDYDCLKDAIKKLSVASEEQFSSIKKEKWYNRVFDMVTFSQKGKKRLAEQISTVAQAQQILVEMLLRLVDNDEEISGLITECMVDIERIQQQNIFMLKRIKKLENISLGIKRDTDIRMLSKKDRELLSGCLYYINKLGGNSSEAQKRFANGVITYIDSDVQMDNPIVGLDDVDIGSKRKILACCMEYMYLKDCSINFSEKYQKFIEEFDFGRKTIQSITMQIESLYKLRGIDGLVEKYHRDYFEEEEVFFFVDFEEEDIGISSESYADKIVDETKGIKNASAGVKLEEEQMGHDEHIAEMTQMNEADLLIIKDVVAYRLGKVTKQVKCGGTLFKPVYSEKMVFEYIELITYEGKSIFVYDDKIGYENFKKDFTEKKYHGYQGNEITHEFWVDHYDFKYNYGSWAVWHQEADYHYRDIKLFLEKLKNRLYRFDARKTDLGTYKNKNIYTRVPATKDIYLTSLQSVVSLYSDNQLLGEEGRLENIVNNLGKTELVNIVKDEVKILQENYARAKKIVIIEVNRRIDKLDEQINDLQKKEESYELNQIEKMKRDCEIKMDSIRRLSWENECADAMYRKYEDVLQILIQIECNKRWKIKR